MEFREQEPWQQCRQHGHRGGVGGPRRGEVDEQFVDGLWHLLGKLHGQHHGDLARLGEGQGHGAEGKGLRPQGDQTACNRALTKPPAQLGQALTQGTPVARHHRRGKRARLRHDWREQGRGHRIAGYLHAQQG